MIGTTVYVTVYSHKHGEDIRVWQSIESALNYKNQIAEEFWDDEFPDEPRPEDASEIGEQYFFLMGDYGHESFSLNNCMVEP